jgi:hypothetical protein
VPEEQSGVNGEDRSIENLQDMYKLIKHGSTRLVELEPELNQISWQRLNETLIENPGEQTILMLCNGIS